MLWHQQIPSRVLGPKEIETISQAYDLALLGIADEGLVFANLQTDDIKNKMSIAIMDAFSNGVMDIQMLKITGISAVTRQNAEPTFFTEGSPASAGANAS